MSGLEEYRELVDAQREQLTDLLARLGLGGEYGLAIEIPDEDTPLASLFVGLSIVSENLEITARQRDEALEEARSRAATIAAQARSLLELSTPVIEVWDRVLVLPLIGTIDTRRAEQVVNAVLDAIARVQAVAVIVDITGVPVVDTAAAEYLLRTVTASRLLGAEAIISGVSPTNAQTLVKLGVALKDIPTRGTLKAALQHALAIAGAVGPGR